MTSNQIEYAKHLESKRHNIASEDISRRGLDESVRHNKASESISTGGLEETRRHNIATEAMSADQILKNYTVGMSQASAAASQASAALKQAQVAAARQAEDARHNKQSEVLTSSDIASKYSLQAANLAESKRHNAETEIDTDVSNMIQAMQTFAQAGMNAAKLLIK